MSRVLTAKEVCERALRAIGEFPITESAADGEQLREAMLWLDLIMGEFAGTTRVFFFVPDTIALSIVNGTTRYDLRASLGADMPVDRIQFPVNAWLEDEAGNRTPLEIAPRDKFDDVSKAADTGPPCMIHIDRLPAPTLRIYPTPAATDTKTWTVKLDVQTYAPNVAPTGVTGTQLSPSALTGFRQAWQRWLVLQLSFDLGSGAVRKIAKSSLDNFKTEATAAKTALLAFENREHDTTPPVTEPWGM